MTKKDFILIADEIAATPITCNLTELQREDLAVMFASRLKHTNERFDAERFYLAATDGRGDLELLRSNGFGN